MGFNWTHNGVFRSAKIAPDEPSDDCYECEATPVCSPSGKTFALSIADPALVWYGNGTHVATATVQ